ncbi:hypothetical protein ACFSTE_04540 [Aquimarina hainanensis]|uniref:Uncharacterized protein n=1 Tax=Aquimarina hainanensis TaxID=1578017 RepID=A0ABW5N5L4_9FLAO
MKKKIFTIVAVGITLVSNAQQQNRIESTGNIGIGTTTPAAELEIKSASDKSAKIHLNASTDGRSSVIRFQDAGENTWAFLSNYPTNKKFSLYNYHNNTNAIIVNEKGEVGIGITNPGSKLDVNGTVRFKGAANGSTGIGDGYTHFPHANGNNYIRGNTFISSTDEIQLQAENRTTIIGGTFDVKTNSRFKGATNGNTGMGDGYTHLPHANGNNYIRGNTFITTKGAIELFAESKTTITGGKVGIGTTDPKTNLEVYKYNGTSQLRLHTNQHAGTAKLEIAGGSALKDNNPDNYSGWSIYHSFTHTNKDLYFRHGQSGIPHVIFADNGNVAIFGKLESKEVKVTNTPTADFVFEENYELPSLNFIAKYIKDNKHLPEIASAKEMKRNGVNIGKFQIQLLQKIEELTLYTIQQEKQINKQTHQINELKSLVKQLIEARK